METYLSSSFQLERLTSLQALMLRDLRRIALITRLVRRLNVLVPGGKLTRTTGLASRAPPANFKSPSSMILICCLSCIDPALVDALSSLIKCSLLVPSTLL
uniref:Uncharacterized protein n=1 Tax=Cacopsylla melanoneura TaxID=428564 RepID=A0A8D9B2B9_9HEMI